MLHRKRFTYSNEIVQVKLNNTENILLPAGRNHTYYYIFIASRTVFTAPDKQKLGTVNSNTKGSGTTWVGIRRWVATCPPAAIEVIFVVFRALRRSTKVVTEQSIFLYLTPPCLISFYVTADGLCPSYLCSLLKKMRHDC